MRRVEGSWIDAVEGEENRGDDPGGEYEGRGPTGEPEEDAPSPPRHFPSLADGVQVEEPQLGDVVVAPRRRLGARRALRGPLGDGPGLGRGDRHALASEEALQLLVLVHAAPAARSASRSPRALAGDETRRHPPTSTRVRHVRVTRVARRGTETPTHATIEIDAIAIECLDVSVERVRGRSPEPCARQRSGLGWYSARAILQCAASDVASLVNTTATASLIARSVGSRSRRVDSDTGEMMSIAPTSIARASTRTTRGPVAAARGPRADSASWHRFRGPDTARRGARLRTGRARGEGRGRSAVVRRWAPTSWRLRSCGPSRAWVWS